MGQSEPVYPHSGEPSAFHDGKDYLKSLTQWRGSGDFDLRNMSALMASLGDPQNRVPAVHVAGTNGKGSVSSTVAAILGASGQRVGMNISPHLVRLNERIVIDGVPATDDLLTYYAREVRNAADRLNLQLSMHEGITALAFLAFADQGLDWIAMEVGLGGRLDASNVIARPAVCGIVTIDFDHELILGSTLTQIAREKAGIIKQGSQLVVGELSDEARAEINRIAVERSATVFALGDEFSCTSVHDSRSPEENDRMRYQSVQGDDFTIEKSLKGVHQRNNCAVAVRMARAIGASAEDCQNGCRNVFWPARLEVINWNNRAVLIDCAHNPHGMRALVDNLSRWGLSQITCGFGVLDTKNWQEMVKLLIPLVKEWEILTPDSERALDPAALMELLSGFGVSATVYSDDYERFVAQQRTRTGPLLLTGSMYMIGDLRQHFVSDERPIWSRGGYSVGNK